MVCNGWDYSIICLSGSYPIKATIEAWSSNFKGDAAAVLLATISDYLDKKRECYVRLASIVNSSGTGKSRMVDEISTKIIKVPMCLHEDGTRGLGCGCAYDLIWTGFPPSDLTLRTWLLSAANPSKQGEATKQLHTFVYSLLTITCDHLKTIDSDCGDFLQLACQLRINDIAQMMSLLMGWVPIRLFSSVAKRDWHYSLKVQS